MKNVKKFLTIALVALFALGMIPMTAFAVSDIDNLTLPKTNIAVSEITEIPVYKTVTVDTKGTLLPTEEFTITMVPAPADELEDATDAVGQKVEQGPSLADDTVYFEFNADDSTDNSSSSVTKDDVFVLEFNDAEGKSVPFDHTGIYRYYVTEENAGENNGYIKYDDTQYIVDLYVSQDAANNFYVSNYVVTIKDENVKPQRIEFTNSISCANLKIYKQVVGTEYQQGELYTFRILIPTGGTTIYLEEGYIIQAQICDATGVVADERTGGTGIVEIKVAGDDLDADMETYATEFQLKNGEYLEILGAPVTMVYKVEEVTDKIEEEGYTVSYDYKEYGENSTDTQGYVRDQEGNEVIGTINTESNEITFKNTRVIEVPNSGISMDILPYVLILAVAACGCILFVMKRRKAAR